jgi:serine/threonine protein phosphatase PrpC
VAEREPDVTSLGGEDKAGLRLCARVAHATDVGRRRRNNQDNHLVLPLNGGKTPENSGPVLVRIDDGRLLVAVADGMGGHYGGEVASRLCVESLAKEIVNQLDHSGNGKPDLPAALRRAVDAAHHAVFAHAQDYAENVTMGTTLTAMLVSGRHAEVAQVGDSRAYLYRDGNLILLTQDQTIGNQLRSRGQDSSTVDENIRAMLVQAVGAQENIEVIMTAVDLEPQDYILLCCDGLYKVVPPEDIVDILEMEIGLHEKATHLITRANEGGGPDNITVILTEICQAESTR